MTLRSTLIALSTFILAAALLPGQSGQERGRPQEGPGGTIRGKNSLRHEGETFLRKVRQITFEGEKSGEAYFSPDGETICFQSVRPGCPHYQIFVKRLDGTRLVKVSPGQGLTTCSFFHPTAPTTMLWASTHLDPDSYGPPPHDRAKRYVWEKHKSFDIFVSDIEGGHVKRLTDAPGYDAEGSYSPDGTRICFTSERDGDFEIYTMASDGSDVRRVTFAKGYDGGPFYSPDGKKICFRGFRDPENPRGANLYVIDADGGNEQQLTFDTGVVNWAPYFDPTGRYLIYSKSMPGGRGAFDLFVIPVTGGKSVQITTEPGADVLPVISPDGTKLLWTSTRVDGRSQVFLAEFTMPDEKAFQN